MPRNDLVKDIQRKHEVEREMVLVGLLGTRLVATVMAGYEGHRGWINYLAVGPDCRKSGFGRDLMEEAEARLRTLGCPEMNSLVKGSNVDLIGFYKGIGFSVDDVFSMGKSLEED